jgi:hypothetical protein
MVEVKLSVRCERKLFPILFIDIGHGLIYCFKRYIQVLFGMSVGYISMMVRVKKDASPDKLSVKIIPSGAGFIGIRFILLEGYVKHRCNAR